MVFDAPIFDEPDVVTGNSLNQRLGRVQLAQGNPEVVRIVESVEKIAVEGVDVDKAREAVDGGRQALGEGFGGVFDLARIEGADSADLEACTNLRGKSPLSAHS